MFTWTPLYKELAKALLAYKNRQPDLVAILNEIKNTTAIPIIRLIDAPKPAMVPLLTTIDPFTFFACFNRGLTDQNRFAIIKILKEKLQLKSDIPTDFSGIPVVDNMKSWFFPFASQRKPDDIPGLWKLAEAVLLHQPEQLDPVLFNRCLQIDMVGPAKLTMGMFWINPDNYLALDEKNTSSFAGAGITTKVTDHASYVSLLRQVREKMGNDFTQISRSAWETATQEIQYWAGGSTWGTEKKADEFVKGNFWQIGWDKDDDESAAKKTWASYPNIKIGDEFAIKGLGGRYDLVVYYVGKVISKSEDGILKLQKLDRPLFRGKGPQGANWFDTIVPVTNKAAIDAVFYGKSKENALAAPFNEFFASFEEANQGFDLIKETLVKFGVNPAEPEKDGRISLTLVGKRNRMRLNFADWGVLTFNPLTHGDKRLDFMCIKKLIPATAQNTESDFEFSDTVDGQEFGSGTCTVPVLHDPESDENQAYLQSLELASKRFQNSKGSRWAMNHEPPVLQMVFDTELRQKLLKEGLNPAGETTGENEIPPKEPLPASLNIILYGPPGTGKTYRLRNHYMEKYFTDRQAMPTPEERAAALVKDLSWWEVIALALLDTKEHKATVADILSHPLVAAQVRKSSNNNPRAMIWASLQIHTKDECPNVKYTSRSQPLVFEKDESSVWSIDVALVDKEAPELPEMLNRFNHPEKNGPPVAYRYRFTTFHQSFSYEDFIEGIKPQMGDAVGDRQNDQVTYEIKDGVFKEICREAKDNPTKKYALFIDEINRGNVASIFGELITLIEDDKRLGRKNQLTAVLPYSRKEFGVPDNLYIIGTMNTADRSVEALDTALRRRFVFEEMRPDREEVSLYPDGKVDLQKMFEVINARIEQLLDHDHCIGHAYFMGIDGLDDLRSVFANKILPLLREYFYGNPAKVGMVLGDRFVLRQTNKRPFAPGSWGADELDEKDVFAFADVTKLTEADFATIYAEVRPGI